MSQDLNLLMLPAAEQLLQDICAQEAIDPALIRRLIAIERDFAGMVRRRGIQDAIDAALSEVVDHAP